MKLITDRGWAWPPEQWEMMLALGPGWGAFDATGLLGTALTTPYPRMQAISGVLVGSWAARRGVGTGLMTHVLDVTPPGLSSVLFATAMGEPIYTRLGFHPVGGTTELHGEFAGAAAGVTRPATPADLAVLAALDHEVSGFARPALWERLLDPASPYRVLMSDSGVVASRPNPGGVTVGPLIAPSAAVACALVADLAAGAGRVRVDTGDPEVAAFLRGRGFEEGGGGCTLMVRGADDVPGDRSRYFAPASHALG
ncbi:GNAT family N-acetyltransferase [Nocardia sp. NRRL S-836]|uniref:GNAT family N-acetyltransferase n=1 Tax=Nocardia sp. NRRL S-836 TaxID=1519492 RepID=UPI0012F7D0C0|nr:GNAT family N-acetyltransferase [Nocardia sp. NRRL S-836]